MSMSASQFITDPLNGKTTLWRVAWLYSFIGGAVLQIAAVSIVEAGASRELVLLAGLVYGTFVTFAAYRCAVNCPWPILARLVRLCSLFSLLVVVPFAVY